MKQFDNCPHCGENLIGEDIFKHFRNSPKYETQKDAEILEMVKENYGYTLENPTFFRKEIALEYSGVYDGTLMWKCPSCKQQWGRFTGILNAKPLEEVKARFNNENKEP